MDEDSGLSLQQIIQDFSYSSTDSLMPKCICPEHQLIDQLIATNQDNSAGYQDNSAGSTFTLNLDSISSPAVNSAASGQAWTTSTNYCYDIASSRDPVDSQATLSYIGINGLEKVVRLRLEDILSLSRVNKLQTSFYKHFPFFKFNIVECTDVTYFDHSKKVKHLYALECPSRIASKLGIKYEKTSSQDLVDDDLNNV